MHGLKMTLDHLMQIITHMQQLIDLYYIMLRELGGLASTQTTAMPNKQVT